LNCRIPWLNGLWTAHCAFRTCLKACLLRWWLVLHACARHAHAKKVASKSCWFWCNKGDTFIEAVTSRRCYCPLLHASRRATWEHAGSCAALTEITNMKLGWQTCWI